MAINNIYTNNLFTILANQYDKSQFEGLADKALARGIDAAMQDDLDGAVREFRRAIGLAPRSANAPKAVQFLADIYQKQGKTDEAISAYKQAIQVDPINDSYYLNLGNLYFEAGRKEDAEAAYTQAVRLNPTSKTNIYSLGQGYLSTGQYKEAETQFKRVLSMNSNDASAYFALGQTYRKMGSYEDSIRALDQALEIDKNFTTAYYELGLTYIDAKNMDMAKEQVAELSKQDTDLSTELQNQIDIATQPRIVSGFSLSGFNMFAGPGTKVSSLDPALATPGAIKSFSMNFIFSKEMDPQSVQDITKWDISRAKGAKFTLPYNLGLPIPSTEVDIPSLPLNIIYNSDTQTADVTFLIPQNAAGDGTIDTSHLVFRFSGKDAYGNAMDTSGDEFNGISLIV